MSNKTSITITIAEEGSKYCNKLFKIEHDLSEVTDEDCYKLRLEQSKPALNAFCHGLILKANKFCLKVL